MFSGDESRKVVTARATAAGVMSALLGLLALACRGREALSATAVVVRNPGYLVVRSITREADAEHTVRVDLPYAGSGYGFVSDEALLDLTAFDLGGATVLGGRTSIVGEATIWLPLKPDASRRLEDWSARRPGERLGIFLEGRLVAAPQIKTAVGGGMPLAVAGKSEADAVLKRLRAGGAAE